MKTEKAKRKLITGGSQAKQSLLVLFLEKNFWLLSLAIFGVIVFFTCYRLGQLPARDWDEARHGISAYEMMKSGDYIVNTYQYANDYYNLKPPMSFWGIVLGYKLFGFTLFGMRFYSALAFILSVASVFFFCFKRYGRIEALCTLLFLACASPFYRYHFARHADADSLFSLFVLISLLALMLMEEWSPAIYICPFAFSLSFLTKSWHSLYVPLIVFVFMLLRKMFFSIKPLQWCGFIGMGALPLFLWGMARFSQDGTKFFIDMIRVDLLNRTTQVLEGHFGSSLFYPKILFYRSLITGFLPVALIILYVFFSIHQSVDLSEKSNFKHDLPVILMWFFVPLVLFSIAKTKLSWYSIPILYPIIIFSGVVFALMLQSKPHAILGRAIACALVVLVVVPSFMRTYQEIQPAYSDDLQWMLHDEKSLLSATAGSTAYIVADNANLIESGKQKYVLLGELYYDWKCKEGDVDSFLSDQGASVMVISQDIYQNNLQKVSMLKTLTQNQYFYILTK
ncbi:MAG: glycosyltransferase family 39 protein [Candidatus Fimivivens sp.]|nr:glycosyltransferase family 39 protein [Candidatus Fimivivens sp.]